MNPTQLPIGYWIKQVDTLLTTKIDAIQAAFGLKRTGWQMLNTIHEKEEIDTMELERLMQPFLSAAAVAESVRQFEEDGLLLAQGSLLRLTEKGRMPHAACLAQQQTFRKAALTGISEERYNTTVETLQQMAANLSRHHA